MSTTAEAPPADWKEGRRLRALDLHEAGWTGKRIAEALGVTRGAVSQWLTRARDGGREALRRRTAPGATPKLTAAQREQLPELLATGAERYDFIGDVWTTKRVARVIKQEFGVQYHPAHVSRVLRAIGWSVQKPIRRATQRDETAIATWRDQTWPALRAKRAMRAGRSSS